ncbi:MAG: alanine--glyoxylate aminotransferase family protein [Chloroflexi bacterium]|nr:MAG: alanine--glyoxylate aminotransferase family protein [Chloroflexota bacterium]MBL1195690.1 alanine--glyoxylate aminotransferase family protein [Chloroflexota bacterium]NOH12978.1 alanine--glyoxylate aminotransferase family protein [Chloroflexota bacterium]
MDATRYTDLNTAQRTLLGPGPSMVHPRVLRAMATPLIGHLDPQFIAVMNEVQELLRYVFQTENELTIPVSGTGSASMEAALVNFIEPGDRVLVAVNGYFGERLCDMAGRYGAEVDRIDRPWGEVFDPQEIADALKKNNYKLLALVHAETSTGARQPDIATIAKAAHEEGALVVLDTVTSLGGLPVKIDEWNVDVAYSGAQKCLSVPPGVSPLTISERARTSLRERKSQVANWYLDLTMVEKYWGDARTYHHTAPVSMNFALREGLRLIAEEGLEARFERHQANAEMLWAGLEELDLPPLVPKEYRLPSLTTPQLSPSVDDAVVRGRLLNEYNIEIAGGFGPLAGKVWRIGLMGFSSRKENVLTLLAALKEVL